MNRKIVVSFLLAGLLSLSSCSFKLLKLSTFERWIKKLDVDNVASMKFSKGGIGVAPDCFIDVKYSTEKEDIKVGLELLNQPLEFKGKVSVFNSLCGGSFSKIEITKTDGTTKEIKISNSRYSTGLFYFETTKSLYPKLPVNNNSYCAFSTNTDVSIVNNNEELIGSFNISSLEFTASEIEILFEDDMEFLEESEYHADLGVFGHDLYIMSDTYFVYNYYDCKLINTTFSELIGQKLFS